ncbi:MAG: dihydroneopterin aldolase family protein [Candidatus Caldarchaeales archaeon]
MRPSRDPAAAYFPRDVTERERAAFEAGIALATVYRALVGLPVPRTDGELEGLARGVASAVLSQPFREEVEVRVRRPRGRRGKGPYSYGEIGPSEVYARVRVRYGEAEVVGELSFVKELNYPLMRIVEIGPRSGSPKRVKH